MELESSSLHRQKTIIKTKTAEFYWMDQDILRINILEGSEVDIEEWLENFNMARELSNHKPCLKLLDTRVIWTISNEARKEAAKRETPEFNIARAVIVNSLASRLLVNFFIRFHKPSSPVKIFNTERVALKWLRSFI